LDGGKAPAVIGSQPAGTNGTSYHSKLLGRYGFYSLTGGSSAAGDGLSKSGKTPFVRLWENLCQAGTGLA